MSDTAAEPFALEAIVPGVVPPRVIAELREAHRIATDYALGFGDALKAQAEKHKVAPKALRRYIVALESDKVKDAEKEADDLARLIEVGIGA